MHPHASSLSLQPLTPHSIVPAERYPVVPISRQYRHRRRTIWLYRVHSLFEPASVTVFGSVSRIPKLKRDLERLTELGRVVLKPCDQDPAQDKAALQNMVAKLLAPDDVPADMSAIDVAMVSLAWGTHIIAPVTPPPA